MITLTHSSNLKSSNFRRFFMENLKHVTNPLYTINQVSQMTHLSKSTIRYYEDIGLISDIFRDKNNIRLFSDNNVSRS